MATTTQALAQTSVNIAVALQNNLTNGNPPDIYQSVNDLCGAVIALAEAYNASLVAGAVAVGTSVNTTVAIGTQYSAVQPFTSPVITKQR
jgi:hypothetical protein